MHPPKTHYSPLSPWKCLEFPLLLRWLDFYQRGSVFHLKAVSALFFSIDWTLHQTMGPRDASSSWLEVLGSVTQRVYQDGDKRPIETNLSRARIRLTTSLFRGWFGCVLILYTKKCSMDIPWIIPNRYIYIGSKIVIRIRSLVSSKYSYIASYVEHLKYDRTQKRDW